MRPSRRVKICLLVSLVSIPLGCLLREVELTIRTYGLAQAVNSSDHRNAVKYLIQGTNPDVLVADRPDPLRPDQIRYRSLLLLARDREDASMVLLLKWYGASGFTYPTSRNPLQPVRSNRRAISEMVPDLSPMEQVAQRVEWNSRSRQVDFATQESFSRLVSTIALQLYFGQVPAPRAN